MADGIEESGVDEGAAGRRVVYCLIPADLAADLHEPLRKHFRDDPGVEVVVERRRGERRSGEDRRGAPAGEPGAEGERRQIRAAAGRRVAERRAALVPVEPPELPRRARRHADRLSFAERLEPATEQAEDLDTARVVMRVQAGDEEAFSILYTRYFQRVYGYLRVALKDSHEAEDATQHVFMRLFESIHSYERRRQPFRAWLFVVVRNQARDYIAKRGRIEPMDLADLNDAQERLGGAAPELSLELGESPALAWITNQDLLVLVERLPPAQRQVLALRYMLGLKPGEIAKALGIPANRVSVLHYRALGFLRERLIALGREPGDRRGRARMARIPQKATVLRLRRFALKL